MRLGQERRTGRRCHEKKAATQEFVEETRRVGRKEHVFSASFGMICQKTSRQCASLLLFAISPAARSVTGLVGPWATQIISFISTAAKTNLRAD